MASIIDLTRAWAGTAEVVLEAVLSEIPDSGSSIEVHGPAAQEESVRGLIAQRSATFCTTDGDGTDWATAAGVAKSTERMLAEGSDVRIYSFSPVVKQFALNGNTQHHGRVTFFPLAPYARTATPEGAWDHDFMTTEGAGVALARAVSMGGEEGLNKTDIRPLLEAVDRRFSKHAGGFAASPGFISALVKVGVDQGLVTTAGIEPRIKISLTDRARSVVGASPQLGAPSSGEGLHAGPEDNSRTRSDQFLDAWRKANLGPFMDVRIRVYDEIARSVGIEPTTLGALVSDAVTTVRQSTPHAGEKFPWARVTQFIETLMRQRPVAMSDGNLVSRSWANSGLGVQGLVDGWQLLLDGELLLHLIDGGFRIDIQDMPDLGGALYGSRSEADIERAFAVVGRLIGDGVLADSGHDLPLQRATSFDGTGSESAPDSSG